MAQAPAAVIFGGYSTWLISWQLISFASFNAAAAEMVKLPILNGRAPCGLFFTLITVVKLGGDRWLYPATRSLRQNPTRAGGFQEQHKDKYEIWPMNGAPRIRPSTGRNVGNSAEQVGSGDFFLPFGQDHR